MRPQLSIRLAALLSALVFALLAVAGTLPEAARAAPPASTSTTSVAPLMFTENVGQFDQHVRFRVQGSASSIDLAADAIWLSVLESTSQPKGQSHRQLPQRGVAIKLSFVGANPHPRLEPFARLAATVSYLRGADAAQWRAGVPVWAGVRYVNLYPGIDLEVTSVSGRLVPRVLTRAGADMGQVRLRIEGADQVLLNGSSVRLTTAIGTRTLPLLEGNQTVAAHPVVQQAAGRAFEVAAPFAAGSSSATSVTNNPASDLLYSTFLGGNNLDLSSGIAVDRSGAAYVVGYTASLDFPSTPGAFQATPAGGICSVYGEPCDDTFVVKLSRSGSNLIYATFIGGSRLDRGNGIAVDKYGAAYITGTTTSPDFPVSRHAFDTSFSEELAGFVVKLNPTGTALAYGTFLDHTIGQQIAVDWRGAAYVTGLTNSPDFPATPGAFDTTYNGDFDAVALKLNATGRALIYATYLGSSAYDAGSGIAVDRYGAAYVTGDTWSSDFPATPGAFDTSQDGLSDAFVVKLTPTGSGLIYATLLGGTHNEAGHGIALDWLGDAYITGATTSADFPATSGAFDTSYNYPSDDGFPDAFVAKLNPAGSALVYATFLGGTYDEVGYGIAVNWRGEASIAGETLSENFPTTLDAFDTSFNTSGDYDGFLATLNADGSALAYATFLGGDETTDSGRGVAVDWQGSAYVVGHTMSTDFPTTVGAYDTTYNGGNSDIFVSKLTMSQ